MLQAHSFFGSGEGPHVLFLGGVHGNEPCGVLAITRIIQKLDAGVLTIERGTATFIACCNPAAYARDVIYIDQNLNRCITPQVAPVNNEQRLANALIKAIDACDVLIDLHSTTAPTKPFAFLDTDSSAGRAMIAGLGVDTVLVDWPALYPNDSSPTTNTYAEAKGKLATTIECGQHRQDSAPIVAESVIMNGLNYFGMIAADKAVPQATSFFVMTHVFYQDGATELVRPFNNFDPVTAGEVLARKGNGTIQSPYDGLMIMPRPQAPKNEELFYLARVA